MKSWLTGKDPDAGSDWGQEEKGTTEDEMAGWHHWLDGRESEWTPGVGDGQGGLACCDSWGCKELDTTERLNWTELNTLHTFIVQKLLINMFQLLASLSLSGKWCDKNHVGRTVCKATQGCSLVPGNPQALLLCLFFPSFHLGDPGWCLYTRVLPRVPLSRMRS